MSSSSSHFRLPQVTRWVLSAYFVACYQLEPDVLLKKPLVADRFHTDILGGGLSQVIISKIACVHVWGMSAMRRQKIVHRFVFVR